MSKIFHYQCKVSEVRLNCIETINLQLIPFSSEGL